MEPKSLTSATDQEILQILGARLRSLREARALTLLEAAAGSGLSRRTIYRAEAGRNPTLASVLRLLRLYGRLEAMTEFIPEPTLSPLALLAQRAKAAKARKAPPSTDPVQHG